MPDYMLLLYDNPTDFQDVSPGEMQKIIEKYRAWGGRLRAAGRLIDSHKLRDGQGRVVTPGNGKPRVLDGPYSETKEVVGGYFAVRAADYDEAVKLCADCPHLELGGTIEVREIEPTGEGCNPA